MIAPASGVGVAVGVCVGVAEAVAVGVRVAVGVAVGVSVGVGGGLLLRVDQGQLGPAILDAGLRGVPRHPVVAVQIDPINRIAVDQEALVGAGVRQPASHDVCDVEAIAVGNRCGGVDGPGVAGVVCAIRGRPFGAGQGPEDPVLAWFQVASLTFQGRLMAYTWAGMTVLGAASTFMVSTA